MSLIEFENFVFRVPIEPVSILNDVFRIDSVDKNKINKALFREALFLATPELSTRLTKWFKDDVNTLENFGKLDFSYLKYLIRMSTRCTPFGLFAGCSVGKIGSVNDIELNEKDKFQKKIRLDMDVIGSLCQGLKKRKDVFSYLVYHVNTSLYELGDSLRYVEVSYKGSRRKYQLSSVESDEYLLLILDKAKQGKRIDELLCLLTDEGFEEEEALAYLHSLIDSQLLVSELELPVIGDNALKDVIHVIRDIPVLGAVCAELEKINGHLQKISEISPGVDITTYQTVKSDLSPLIKNLNSKYLFQCDLSVTPKQATVDSKILDHLKDAFGIINKLSIYPENEYLNAFKKKFYERYEEEEVPLVEALDTESGIGFGRLTALLTDVNSLVDDLYMKPQQQATQVALDKIQLFLVNKYDECIKDKSLEIVIQESELNDFPENWSDLPKTMSAMVEILDKGSESKEPLIHVGSFGGSTAAKLMGRFCHLSPEIKELVEEIVSVEEKNQDVLHAEIVHLPESRVGNILVRPDIRQYEIPYLVNSLKDLKSVINISDIMISVNNGERIVLRSKKNNKEINLFNTTAHNFSGGSLPIYQFLSSMQNNGKRSFVSFGWGAFLTRKPFLPRVRYKNIIISLAKWNISKDDYVNIPDVNEKNFMEEVNRLKKRLNLPNKFYLIKGDNKLYIDISLSIYAKILFMEVKKNPFTIEEFLFNEKNSLVTRDGKSFTNECIFFYKNNSN
ncbi:hypothetical protein EO244_00490 [Ancylomarina salipaludis]|uniref:Lantibiotic dehydratase N-terminal domain-containing protein n=1 Tax=Ancylomarina salipaludis TaxID=2501299 RepID=A0A4Q1JR23_9BACT|nr:lantibiotic dehydratase family protein [Ancylomarina salipaludis]RXQ97400.1 hypothetical protein EO244_00490 [Ancylomarina salipaludis]